ncbi:type II secretion system protein [Anoxybacterium hadale]|uniref:Type II secretion system protein n=1 Tax=Anoxybacterium hadale TaxID=3408580 RepID=A0ACD1A9B5_9FIRM|nr:type II secretion system protein [Clostridiales bacterium]
MRTIWNNRKKGFTLIELMVAITILAIIYPAIASAFVTAQKTMEDENSTLETLTQAQYLVQSLQVQRREGMETIYGKYKESGHERASLFLYYTDNDEIASAVEQMADPELAASDIDHVLEALAVEADASKAKEAMASASIDRRYAAHILIQPDLQPDSEEQVDYFKVYKIVINTWKLSSDSYSVGSRRVAYIGE